MIKSFWQKNWQHFAAIGIFLLVAVIYCKPALDGLVLDQHDIQGWKGMAQHSIEYKEKYGHYPYWTNSMFSGMPGYQIAFETPNKISIGVLHNYIFTLGLPKPINYFFLASIMAYFLFCVLRIRPWISMMGAIAYAYAAFNAIIVFVGHDTQMICIGYAPAVIASLLLLFDRKYILGTLLTSLFAAMIVWQNHVQITYYTFITAFCIGVSYIIHAYKTGQIKNAITAGGLALVAAAISLGVNTINIWPINEFAKETMRGGRSELTDTATAKTKTVGGLDKEYAFQYSLGKIETFTFIVPRLYGGSGNQVINNEYRSEFKPDSKLAQTLTEKAGLSEDQAAQTVAQMGLSPYWGDQQGTAGPVYFGAVICVLFVFGLLYVKSWHKWWLVAATVIGIILAWGKNWESLNYFLFDHLPLYKKFRAVTMALVIPQLTFPVLACLALQQFFTDLDKDAMWKKLKLTMYVTAGIFAILTMFYFSFGYTAPAEKDIKQGLTNMMLQQLSRGQQPNSQMQQQAEDFGRSMVKALKEDRQGLYGADLFRSFLLIALTLGLLTLYAKGKTKTGITIAGIAFLSCYDIFNVDTRYLNYKNYAEPAVADAVFNTNPAIEKIKADPDHNNFRVFDQPEFSSSTISYYFNSIGGYSPAKLGLYEDLIEQQISDANIHVLNMLNAKYFVVRNPANGNMDAQLNPGALGNAWFIKGFVLAKNADEEMDILTTLNTKDSAVIDARFTNIAGAQPVYDSTAKIQMVENTTDKIIYKTTAAASQFAVLSEIYYPHGWDAYIDGNQVEYARVNYVLRGLPVPAGSHTMEFRFEPRSVILGDRITRWMSILLYLMIAVGLIVMIRKKKIL
jgi:Bacterial membrane protein YfhO